MHWHCCQKYHGLSTKTLAPYLQATLPATMIPLPVPTSCPLHCLIHYEPPADVTWIQVFGGSLVCSFNVFSRWHRRLCSRGGKFEGMGQCRRLKVVKSCIRVPRAGILPIHLFRHFCCRMTLYSYSEQRHRPTNKWTDRQTEV